MKINPKTKPTCNDLHEVHVASVFMGHDVGAKSTVRSRWQNRHNTQNVHVRRVVSSCRTRTFVERQLLRENVQSTLAALSTPLRLEFTSPPGDFDSRSSLFSLSTSRLRTELRTELATLAALSKRSCRCQLMSVINDLRSVTNKPRLLPSSPPDEKKEASR